MLSVPRLRILREIAERGSIAAAAGALFLTPSAVSQQMATLEREAGVPLLERIGRGVRLTEAGARLVARTPAVLAALEQAEAELAAVSTGAAGHLAVAAFPTAARVLLVPALAELRRDHPRLRVSMVDLEPEQSLPALRIGDLDVVLTHDFNVLPATPDPSVDSRDLLTEPVFLAMPADDPRAGSPISLADLRDDQFIVGHDATPFLDIVVRLAEREGFQPHVDLHSNDFQVILAAVGIGLGVAFVPPLGLVRDYPDVVFKQVDGLDLQRTTRAAIRAGAAENPAVAAMLAELSQVAAGVSLEMPVRG
jgi:DNA-binding transcriptional LysR family regulator